MYLFVLNSIVVFKWIAKTPFQSVNFGYFICWSRYFFGYINRWDVDGHSYEFGWKWCFFHFYSRWDRKDMVSSTSQRVYSFWYTLNKRTNLLCETNYVKWAKMEKSNRKNVKREREKKKHNNNYHSASSSSSYLCLTTYYELCVLDFVISRISNNDVDDEKN